MCIGIEFIMAMEAVDSILKKYGAYEVKDSDKEIRLVSAGFKSMSQEDIEALESVHLKRDGDDWTYEVALLDNFGRKAQ